jgi:hypothetical protein
MFITTVDVFLYVKINKYLPGLFFLFIYNELRWEISVCFVDFGGMVDILLDLPNAPRNLCPNY